jgi:hypothetical protein
MAYRYVQCGEHGTWVPLVADSNFVANAEAMGATRVSALAVSDIVGDDTDPTKLAYAGPLYFDIDHESLPLAIASGQELVGKLRELKVVDEAIEIYCSGSKGLHVFVQDTVFRNSSRPLQNLPAIYAEMALTLYVNGLDFAVYSGGRGRMFRFENGLRPDGRYRVRITTEELDGLTPERYLELVSTPRIGMRWPVIAGLHSPPLEALFDQALKKVKSKPKVNGEAVADVLLKPHAEDPPGCISKLVDYEVRAGINFNVAALQLAAFAARAEVSHYRVDSLVSRMAEKGVSKTYDTLGKRRSHLRGIVAYAKSNSRVVFSCPAMRSVVRSPPCQGCPVLPEEERAKAAELDDDGLSAVDDGVTYGLQMKEGPPKPLSSFVFRALESVFEDSEAGHLRRRTSLITEVVSKGEQTGSMQFDETGWRSRGEFLKQIEGIPGAIYLGGDIDVQRIKLSVHRQSHSEENVPEEVISVWSAGIHGSKLGKQRVWTYVEPGYSVNHFGLEGTHRLSGSIPTPPILRMYSPIPNGFKPLRETMLNLLQVNDPATVAQVLGWFSACHLKAHISEMYHEFPVLNLWGSAGSGKTFTAALFAYLNGVDYRHGGAPLPVASSTLFPIISTVSSTTTIPRVLEEFNQSQMRRKAGFYEQVTEILKAAWDGFPVPRGTLQRSRANGTNQINAEVQQVYVTAPLVVCSEQAPQQQALMTRMVQVEMNRGGRRGRSGYYQKAYDQRELLLSLAKNMTREAMRTRAPQIEQWYKEAFSLLPPSFVDRPRQSYATVLVGLRFLESVLSAIQLEMADPIGGVRTALLGQIGVRAESIVRAKERSEVDLFFSAVAEMAQLSIQNSNVSMLIPGKHFIAMPEQDLLLLDLALVFPLYMQYAKRTMVDQMVFSSIYQLEPLLRSEPYFVSDSRVEQRMSATRTVWAFSVDRLLDKGINARLFQGD